VEHLLHKRLSSDKLPKSKAHKALCEADAQLCFLPVCPILAVAQSHSTYKWLVTHCYLEMGLAMISI